MRACLRPVSLANFAFLVLGLAIRLVGYLLGLFLCGNKHLLDVDLDRAALSEGDDAAQIVSARNASDQCQKDQEYRD